MNIMVAGLTGSGKTTICRVLSQDLGLSFVSGSELRSQFISGNIPSESRKYWLFSTEATELDSLRLTDSRIDLAMDKHLRDLVLTKSRQIFDVWFLPWLIQENSLKVWLECPLEIRARRIHKSLDLGGVETEIVRDKTFEKDTRAQQFAFKTYGIDIFTDRSPFGVLISTANEADVNLAHKALRRIAENYFDTGRKDRGLNSITSDEFATTILRCPPSLYPA